MKQALRHPLLANAVLWMACVLAGSMSNTGKMSAAEPDPAFVAARQAFLRDMKKKSRADRVEAVAKFANFPSPEAVESLLKRGLMETEPTVRLAVRSALRDMGRDPATNRFLSQEFVRYIKKPDNHDVLSGLLGGMIATTDEARIVEVQKTLDDYLAGPKGHLIVPMSLIDDLGLPGGTQQAAAEAVRSITLLTKVKPFETQFGYRRCVVQAMTKIHDPAAIGFLIEMLSGSQGLVQAEIITHLTRTTQQKFKDNDRDWTLWWSDNKAKFQFPAAIAADELNDLRQTTYYGIPICAKRIVFVLDTSGSMRGVPIEAAKVSLLKAIDSLPEAVNFDIVMFDKTAAVWQPRLLPATQPIKQTAAQAVIARGMSVGTASHAALNAAFNLEPEAIYFLSDGEPTDGQPTQIIESMTERNRTRRISIHTIGVVTQRGGGVGLTLFMKPLAEHNFGTFRLVE